MLFGSLVVKQVIYQVLSPDPEIGSVVGESLSGTTLVPQGMPLPAILFAMEHSAYGGSIGSGLAEHIQSEQVRCHVRILCEGTSTASIEAAAVRQAELLLNDEGHHATYNGAPYFLTFSANGEVVPDTLVEGPNLFSQLGTVYNVDIVRGG